MRNTITVILCSLMLLFASSSSHAQSKNKAFDGFLVSVTGGGLYEKTDGGGGSLGGTISYGFFLKDPKIYLGLEFRGMKEFLSATREATDLEYDYSLGIHARFGSLINENLLWVFALGYERVSVDYESTLLRIDDNHGVNGFSFGTEFLYAMDKSLFMRFGYYANIGGEDDARTTASDGRRYVLDADYDAVHRFLFGVGLRF